MKKQTYTLLSAIVILAQLFIMSSSIIAHSVGIIPYVIQPGKGKHAGKNFIFFLLSKDRHMIKYNEWTDFSGSEEPKGKEHPDRSDAAREGYEETDGIFVGHGKTTSKGFVDPIKKKTRGIQNTMDYYLNPSKKINGIIPRQPIKIWGRPTNFKNQEWLTYLVDVTESVKNIGGKQETIKRLETTLETIKANYPDWNKYESQAHPYTEKVDFRWFSKDDFIKIITQKSKEKLNGKLKQVLEKNIKEIKKIH